MGEIVMAEKEKQAFNRQEAGYIWGVSESLVVKRDTAGRINTIRIGDRKLVPRAEIDRVLREGVPNE